MPNIIFIDFEASSLDDDSWPIEIGLAWIDEKEKLRSASKLIKPHPSWSMEAWSDKSQKIHGIELSELEAAPEAQEVARWVERMTGTSILMSDAPPFDGMWMSRLMSTIGQEQSFEIFGVQQEAHDYFDEGRSMFFRAFANGHSTHRAAADALRLAQAWRAALRKEKKKAR
jgi:DNA polymerase III subunit epsilon